MVIFADGSSLWGLPSSGRSVLPLATFADGSSIWGLPSSGRPRFTAMVVLADGSSLWGLPSSSRSRLTLVAFTEGSSIWGLPSSSRAGLAMVVLADAADRGLTTAGSIRYGSSFLSRMPLLVFLLHLLYARIAERHPLVRSTRSSPQAFALSSLSAYASLGTSSTGVPKRRCE